MCSTVAGALGLTPRVSKQTNQQNATARVPGAGGAEGEERGVFTLDGWFLITARLASCVRACLVYLPSSWEVCKTRVQTSFGGEKQKTDLVSFTSIVQNGST